MRMLHDPKQQLSNFYNMIRWLWDTMGLSGFILLCGFVVFKKIQAALCHIQKIAHTNWRQVISHADHIVFVFWWQVQKRVVLIGGKARARRHRKPRFTQSPPFRQLQPTWMRRSLSSSSATLARRRDHGFAWIKKKHRFFGRSTFYFDLYQDHDHLKDLLFSIFDPKIKPRTFIQQLILLDRFFHVCFFFLLP